MILHLRIDNRLIHGQVAVLWVKHIGAERIVVVNDEVAADPIQKMMLPIAAGGVKTSVFTLNEAEEFFKSVNENEKIMIIAKFPSDALSLIEREIKPKEINVGNQASIPGTKYINVTNTIAVTKEDAQLYKKIYDHGYKLNCQMVPSDKNRDFIEMLNSKHLL